ncbi:MAG: hypothetical protein QM765_03780 [Myxococcales bacterium]
MNRRVLAQLLCLVLPAACEPGVALVPNALDATPAVQQQLLSDEPDGHPALGHEMAERLACVLVEPGAVLRIDFGVRGCFGGSDNYFRLTSTPSGFLVEGSLWTGTDTRQRIAPAPVGPDLGVHWIGVLAQALRRPEVEDACTSSAKHFARGSTFCDGRWETTRYVSNACLDLPSDHFSASFPGLNLPPSNAYQYAFALDAIADAALRSMPAQPDAKLTSEEREREGRKWRSLYDGNGMRVRHDPVESPQRQLPFPISDN